MPTLQDARRAFLVAGGINTKQCAPRYANELAWWATGLAARGFSCRVAHGDGSQVPQFAGVPAAFSPATRADIGDGMSWLSEAGELALLMASNHGDESGLCLWGAEMVTPAELGAMLAMAASPGSTRVLVFGQCNSGVFLRLADKRTVVVSVRPQGASLAFGAAVDRGLPSHTPSPVRAFAAMRLQPRAVASGSRLPPTNSAGDSHPRTSSHAMRTRPRYARPPRSPTRAGCDNFPDAGGSNSSHGKR